jgi:hypothetical protein
MWLVFSGVPRVSELPALHLETKDLCATWLRCVHSSFFFLVSILFLAGSVRSVLLYSSFYFIKDGCKIPFPGTGLFCCEKLVECLFW